MRTIELEEFEDFAKHNGDGTGKDWVFADGRYFFPSGAMCDEEFRQRWDAPTDERTRDTRIRRYLILKIKSEQKQFDNFQASCIEQANLARDNPGIAPPTRTAPQQLRAGKERIAKLKAQLAELEGRSLADPESDLAIQQARAEAEAERRASIDDLLAEIVAIEA